VTKETVEAWERGDGAPTYPQMELLAYGVLMRPLAVFFFPDPPDEATPKQSFRTLPAEISEHLPARLRRLIRSAQVMQLNLQELFDNERPTSKSIVQDLQFDLNHTLEDMARDVRDYLGVALLTQMGWHDSEEAFKQWREVLYKNGVFVFKDAFREDAYSGFCIYDSRFPLIYVNNSKPANRQTFTLFHEFAHLLFRTGGIDTRFDDYVQYFNHEGREIEKICNAFTSSFLVPDDDFALQIRGIKARSDTSRLIESLANRYWVSREVILRKLLDRGLVDHEFYEATVKKWMAAKTKGGSGGNFYNNKIAYLGKPYTEAAFTKYYQKRISLNQLADYLGVNNQSVQKLEAHLWQR
jgi:Zn-dependent peptidase ImmA (M78 family)